MFREKDENRSKPAVKTVSGNHLLMRSLEQTSVWWKAEEQVMTDRAVSG